MPCMPDPSHWTTKLILHTAENPANIHSILASGNLCLERTQHIKHKKLQSWYQVIIIISVLSWYKTKGFMEFYKHNIWRWTLKW